MSNQIEKTSLNRFKVSEKEKGKYAKEVYETLQILPNEIGSVSKAIRTLIGLGFTKSETANMLGKRYQHVRNVLLNPLKNQ